MRQIAINAVMAGARPEYLTSGGGGAAGGVRAAVRVVSPANHDPRGRAAHHRERPDRRSGCRINCGRGLFGPGWRANATIGRALRLVLVNVGGAGPAVDASQTGHPGKYTYCIAEYEAANPWEPLHVERGFARGQSVVTVVNTEAPHSMTENIQTDPEEIMRTFASCMATLGVNNLYSQGHPGARDGHRARAPHRRGRMEQAAICSRRSSSTRASRGGS